LAGVEKIGRIKIALANNELARKKRRRSTDSSKREPIRINLELTVGSKIGVLEVHAFHGKAEIGYAAIEYANDKGRMRSRAAARA
jgi:hypothetical protein